MTEIEMIAKLHNLSVASPHNEYGESMKNVLLIGFKSEDELKRIAEIYGLDEFDFKKGYFTGMTSSKKFPKEMIEKGLWFKFK